MSVLVITELKEGNLKKISKELASTGQKLGGPVVAVLFNGNDSHVSELHNCGADTVIKVNGKDFSPEGWANLISGIAKENQSKVVLAPHSMLGKDYAGRVAIQLNANLIADVIEIKGDLNSIELKKPIYSGKAYARIKVSTPVVVTVRPNSQEVLENYNGKKEVKESTISEGIIKAKLTNLQQVEAGKVQLTDASIIVSGGRGIKGPENWPVLQELADLLGAALGASRAAVDAGWIDHSHQVGQTGKTVSPNLYIACGISGAIQHLAGMGSSKIIVAINKDPDANIFKVATYGIVDDLFKVVPAITQELKKMYS
ncbi:MAG: electron transfer flavoprotein subunit alpha/FixB family protein [Leptonema sp. (in: bacteria)]